MRVVIEMSKNNESIYVKVIILLLTIVLTTSARRVYIEKIEFEGNVTFDKKKLLSLMDSKPSSIFHKSLYSPYILQMI